MGHGSKKNEKQVHLMQGKARESGTEKSAERELLVSEQTLRFE